MNQSTDTRRKSVVQSELDAATGNAVAYSSLAWAVARKSASGEDRWFPDSGSHQGVRYLTSGEMVSWADDWVVLRHGDNPEGRTSQQFMDEQCGRR